VPDGSEREVPMLYSALQSTFAENKYPLLIAQWSFINGVITFGILATVGNSLF
jgi:hypothetical protein